MDVVELAIGRQLSASDRRMLDDRRTVAEEYKSISSNGFSEDILIQCVDIKYRHGRQGVSVDKQKRADQQRRHQQLRDKKRRDARVEYLTGIQGMTFRKLVARIETEDGVQERSARRKANELLTLLEIERKNEARVVKRCEQIQVVQWVDDY